MRYLILIPLLLLAACAPERAADDRPVVVSLLRDPVAAEGGKSFTVAWRFEIAEGWHLYWDGLNDSGAPPSIELDLPEGWSAGPLRWPAPERHLAPGGILDHVYHDELVLLQDLYCPTGPDAPFSAKIDWLVCRELCAPGDTVLTSDDARDRADAAQVIGRARTRLPVAMPRGHFTAEWRGAVLTLGLPLVERLTFLPAADCGPLANLAADGVADGDELSLAFRVVDGVAGPVRGLVHGEFGANSVTFEIDIPATEVAVSREDDDG